MSATLEELWPGVEAAAPDNPGPLLVCAEWCDENGEPELAYALRWCAGHQQRPYKRGDVIRTPWLWLRDQASYGHISHKELNRRAWAVIPACIFDECDGDTCEMAYKTALDAYRALGMWLDQVRAAVEVRTIVLPPPVEIVRAGPKTCAQCGIMRSRDVLDCPVCKSGDVKP